MTDREMLEFAAKAAGYVRMEYRVNVPYVSSHMTGDDFIAWNPRASDGDALRLAVRLGISISQERRNGCVFCDAEPKIAADEEYGSDPYAATRLAITRAAAEIGNAMS